MGALVRLAEERLAYLEKQITDKIPEPILTRGWDYFRGKKVFATEIVEGNSIYGAVNGSGVYAVVLDTDEFKFSTCTCPYGGPCKHMASVYYQYCHTIGEDIEEVRQRTLGLIPRAAASPGPEGGDLVQVPGIGAGPEIWRQWFEEVNGETWKLCRHSLHPLQPILSSRKGLSKLWPKSLQRLHWLHVLIFVFEQVEKAYASTDSYNRYYYEMTFTRSVDPWLEHYQELASQIKPEELSDTERKWVESISDTLLELSMNHDYTLLRWDTMHHFLWERLAPFREWREKGRRQLELRLADEAVMESVRSGTILLASLAQLDFCEGLDAAAIGRLEDAEFDRIAQAVYSYAEQRLAEGRFAELTEWMAFLFKRLESCRNSHILHPFLSLCRKADRRYENNGMWLDMMISFLPSSYSELSAHWLDKGEHTAWCDLQQLMGMRPDELDVQDIRKVAKFAPGELLPLYHQAVDESIQTRNRQGYKTAVKLMKMLEKLYKAIGQSDKWTRYVDEFSRKYQRLRALQEELWRGKIIQ